MGWHGHQEQVLRVHHVHIGLQPQSDSGKDQSWGGAAGPEGSLGETQSSWGSSLSRSSGHQSLACDHMVLARPATPVASTAFAHAEDCSLLLLCSLCPPTPICILERGS